MNTSKVILINRMLGYGGLNTTLKGHSGRAYGQPSRYSPEYKCHTVELTLAEYEAAREDIFKKMRSSMSGFQLWEPKIVLGDESVSSATLPLNPGALSSKQSDESSSPSTTQPKWNQLVKEAKAAGVKIKKGGSRADLEKAIAAHKAAKA